MQPYLKQGIVKILALLLCLVAILSPLVSAAHCRNCNSISRDYSKANERNLPSLSYINSRSYYYTSSTRRSGPETPGTIAIVVAIFFILFFLIIVGSLSFHY